MDWFADHYAPEGVDRSDPRLSPLLTPDLTGLPPAYIATAGFDPLRDEGEAYAERLREAGVVVALSRQPDLIHGYINYLGIGRMVPRGHGGGRRGTPAGAQPERVKPPAA